MHHKRSPRLAVITVAIVALFVAVGFSLPGTGNVAGAKPVPVSSPWAIVPSPNPGTNANDLLNGVATIAANDVWAVGTSNSNTVSQSIIEHWDGISWSVVPNAHPGSTDQLTAIAAVSSADVWAVGMGSSQPLIEHWNGTIWSIVPSPTLSPTTNILKGLAVVSASDIWAVGYSDGAVTLTEHWNGSVWNVVPSPSGPVNNAFLTGVTALSATNVWAVGNQALVTGETCTVPLMEHWDGKSWSIVAGPAITGIFCETLSGVAAVSATDIWAVGGKASAFVEHWNGTSWSIVSTPSPDSMSLSGVTVLGPNDVWAVGNGNTTGSGASLTERWNGTSWSIVPSPNGPVGGALAGVASLPNGMLWAVGNQSTADPYTRVQQTFILRNTTG